MSKRKIFSYTLGRCMDNLGCKGMDTRDSYGRDRFLPISLETHLTLGMLEDTWLWDMHPSYYPVQKVCIKRNSTPVTCFTIKIILGF
jgi:hypothetical protein